MHHRVMRSLPAGEGFLPRVGDKLHYPRPAGAQGWGGKCLTGSLIPFHAQLLDSPLGIRVCGGKPRQLSDSRSEASENKPLEHPWRLTESKIGRLEC